MSIAISKIYKEAHKKGMPISSPGLIMFSLESATRDKRNTSKAYRYKIPYFTEARLLTHDQLERINKILEEDVEIISEEPTIEIDNDFPSLESIQAPTQDSKQEIKEESINEPIDEIEKASEEMSKEKREIKSREKKPMKMTRMNKLNKYKRRH